MGVSTYDKVVKDMDAEYFSGFFEAASDFDVFGAWLYVA